MHEFTATAGFIQIFIHNDEDTPMEFVTELMRMVFGKSEKEAIAFAALIERGKAHAAPIRLPSPRRCWRRRSSKSMRPDTIC